jgi:hypothetical protein
LRNPVLTHFLKNAAKFTGILHGIGPAQNIGAAVHLFENAASLIGEAAPRGAAFFDGAATLGPENSIFRSKVLVSQWLNAASVLLMGNFRRD